MFKEIFIKLCVERNVNPTVVCTQIGISKSNFSEWTDKTVPRKTTLQKIADYFGVTVDYLLGKTETPATDYGITENMIVFNLDGQSEKKKLTREQMLMLKAMLDALPDTPTDL